MKTKLLWIFTVVMSVILSTLADIVPSSFNYQGVLLTGSGESVGAGTKDLTFRIYTEATGSDSLVWARKYAVILDEEGLFNTELNDDEGSPLSPPVNDNKRIRDVIADAYGELFIGITVESDEEILPRQQLLAVPYALIAGDVKEARNNFAVEGTLSVGDGATVAGNIEASSLMISTNTNSSTLSIDADNSIEILEGLVVNGQLTSKESVTLEKTLTVAGATTLSDLDVSSVNITDNATIQNATIQNATIQDATLTGAPTLLSASTQTLNDSVNIDAYTDTNRYIIHKAEANGLIVLQIHIKNYKSGHEPSCEVYQNGTSYVLGHTMDDNDYAYKTLTLPMRTGEEVTIRNRSSNSDRYDDIEVKYTFFKFGN